QVNMTNNPLAFTKAIAAKGTITMSGGSVVDSFNSSNTNYSTGGMYDPAKRRANGSVVTDSTATGAHPAINVGTAHNYGTADTGPGGAVTPSSSGTVGDLDWSTNHTGIEAGYTNDDMNVTFPDQVAPSDHG